MNNFLNQQTPYEILKQITSKVKIKRKKLNLSQSDLALKSGVSLGSIKYFENKHKISLISLIKIAIALGCEDDFNLLFSKKTYSSIDEIINE